MSERIFRLVAIMLLVYLAIRLVDQSQVINNFPLDYSNDISSHMAQLHFLAKYGYYANVPDWYNGYILFQFYPPGWFLATLLPYLIIQDLELTAFLSIVAMLTISFLALWFIGREEGLSRTRRVVFFLFLFANPVAVGNFVRLGRVTELFGWMIFILMALLFLRYRKQSLDRWFVIALSLLYSLILLSHLAVALISHVLIISFFVMKKDIKVALALLIGFAMSYFWLGPFLLNFSASNIDAYRFSDRLLVFSEPWLLTNIAGIFVGIAFMFVVIAYIRQSKNKKELAFISPLLLLDAIFLTRLVIFVPFFRSIIPDVYFFFFLFFATFYFLKLNTIPYKRLVYSAVVLLPAVGIAISAVHTPWFIKQSELDKEIISLLPEIDGKFLMLKSPTQNSFQIFYYAYAAVYFNKHSSYGAGTSGMEPEGYREAVRKVKLSLEDGDCANLAAAMAETRTDEIITFGEYCTILQRCGLEEKSSNGAACLYAIRS